MWKCKYNFHQLHPHFLGFDSAPQDSRIKASFSVMSSHYLQPSHKPNSLILKNDFGAILQTREKTVDDIKHIFLSWRTLLAVIQQQKYRFSHLAFEELQILSWTIGNFSTAGLYHDFSVKPILGADTQTTCFDSKNMELHPLTSSHLHC